MSKTRVIIFYLAVYIKSILYRPERFTERYLDLLAIYWHLIFFLSFKNKF